MHRLLAVAGLCLLLFATGCGGGGEEAGSPAEPAEEPLATGVPDPPPQEDIDIDSDGIDVGGNGLSASTSVGEWTLPPTMFGAVEDLQLNVSTHGPAELWPEGAYLQAGDDPALKLMIAQEIDRTNVIYRVFDHSTNPPTEHAVTAYAPVDGDCSIMGTGFVHFTSGGTFVSMIGGDHPLTGETRITGKITPATETGCN